MVRQFAFHVHEQGTSMSSENQFPYPFSELSLAAPELTSHPMQCFLGADELLAQVGHFLLTGTQLLSQRLRLQGQSGYAVVALVELSVCVKK